jgi:hypothetical protein
VHDLKLVAAFAFHILVAVGLFALIGGAAALLDYYTKVLASLGMSPLIVEAIKATEFFLFAVDLLCFVVYTARETWLLLRSMVRPHVAAPGATATTDLPR